jgi:hypothetical protein
MSMSGFDGFVLDALLVGIDGRIITQVLLYKQPRLGKW